MTLFTTGEEHGFAFETLTHGSYRARMICDSISPAGVRISTIELTFPRFVLAEFNTHRAFTRSSASSRAIPVKKMIAAVTDNPYVPERFTENEAGMQASSYLTGKDHDLALAAWMSGRDAALIAAQGLLKANVHKQQANRLLEPFAWHTVLVTATDWSNFLALRAHADAQPEIRRPAEMLGELLNTCQPRQLSDGEWHLPFVRDEERDEFELAELLKIATGRAARVSYATHDGVRDPQADVRLYERLLSGGHMSPMEHVARVAGQTDVPSYITLDAQNTYFGNFRGWVQLRKHIRGESDFAVLQQDPAVLSGKLEELLVLAA